MMQLVDSAMFPVATQGVNVIGELIFGMYEIATARTVGKLVERLNWNDCPGIIMNVLCPMGLVEYE